MKRGSLLVNSSPNFRLATLPFRSDAIRAYYLMCLPLLVPYYCLPDCAPTAVGWVACSSLTDFCISAGQF